MPFQLLLHQLQCYNSTYFSYQDDFSLTNRSWFNYTATTVPATVIISASITSVRQVQSQVSQRFLLIKTLFKQALFQLTHPPQVLLRPKPCLHCHSQVLHRLSKRPHLPRQLLFLWLLYQRRVTSATTTTLTPETSTISGTTTTSELQTSSSAATTTTSTTSGITTYHYWVLLKSWRLQMTNYHNHITRLELLKRVLININFHNQSLCFKHTHTILLIYCEFISTPMYILLYTSAYNIII